MKYAVHILTTEYVKEVEAANKDEAITKAMQTFAVKRFLDSFVPDPLVETYGIQVFELNEDEEE